MVLPCRNQAKLWGFALRFKCPDQSRAPGRKSQFSLEAERTFSANFWEVEQAGFRKLPSKGSGGGGPRPVPVLPDTELLLAMGSHTTATPTLLFGGWHRAVLAQEDGLEHVLPRSGVPVVTSVSQPSQKPNPPSLQTQLLSKLGSMALGMAAGPTASI